MAWLWLRLRLRLSLSCSRVMASSQNRSVRRANAGMLYGLLAMLLYSFSSSSSNCGRGQP
jgi:hypothetical protein